MNKFVLSLLFISLSVFASADVDLYRFDDPNKQALFKELVAEIRCLVCQNQNIADSNADLAKDLRKKTYDMIVAGKNREEIKAYMTDRYGDFVLYRPPLKPSTYLLWSSPVLLLLIGIGVLVSVFRKQKQSAVNERDEAALARAKEILEDS